MTTHQYSLAQRGQRAAILVGAFALCSVVSSTIFIGLLLSTWPTSIQIAAEDALFVVPLIIGATIVIVIQSLRHDRLTRRTAVLTGLMAVLVGTLFSLFFGSLAIIVAVIAPIPVVLGALFAQWMERRACSTWASAEPV